MKVWKHLLNWNILIVFSPIVKDCIFVFGMKQYNLDIILNSLNSLGYKIQKIYSDKLVIKAYL